MKKQLHILKGLSIITIIFISSLLLVSFIYNILHEPVDTNYIWNINITNPKETTNSQKGNLTIDSNKLKLDVTFKEENTFYEATIDIENNGTLDAILEDYKINVDNQKNILTYKITYLDNTLIKKGDILHNNSKKTIKIRIDYPKQEKKIYDELKINISLTLKYSTK